MTEEKMKQIVASWRHYAIDEENRARALCRHVYHSGNDFVTVIVRYEELVEKLLNVASASPKLLRNLRIEAEMIHDARMDAELKYMHVVEHPRCLFKGAFKNRILRCIKAMSNILIRRF